MRYPMALLALVAVFAGCKVPGTHNLPPAAQLMHPGPGVDGPGPGVMMTGGGVPGLGGPMLGGMSSQLAFVGPEGMMVSWDVGMHGAFDSEPLICPGRTNFPQGAIYRLKLTNIPGRPGTELYPTIEVAPVMPRTDAYLAHNAIPVQFTEEDLDQVVTGNFVTKVIYLPDAEFQELAIAGVETLVSTRLDPGVDPIVEADRRGSILAIVRVGNKDLAMTMADDGSMGGMGGVMPTGYCGPGGMGIEAQSHLISGVTAPEWGMTTSGTPIGLPGPPHIPLGIPAGLSKHTIHNHTRVHIPNPTSAVRLDVMQKPGISYPKPANRAYILERTVAPLGLFRQPASDKYQVMH